MVPWMSLFGVHRCFPEEELPKYGTMPKTISNKKNAGLSQFRSFRRKHGIDVLKMFIENGRFCTARARRCIVPRPYLARKEGGEHWNSPPSLAFPRARCSRYVYV